VVAVLTRSAIDQASQATPGTKISLEVVSMEVARRELAEKEEALGKLSLRVAQAFSTRGWNQLLSPDHASLNS
jgi:allophanate hydrolase subunit 2